MFVHTVLVCDYFILDWTLTTSLLIQTRQTLITAICHICLLLLLFSHYHYTLCNSLLHWILFCGLILHKIRSIIRVSSSFLLQQYEMEVGSSSSSLMPHVLKSVSLFWGEKLHLLPIFFFCLAHQSRVPHIINTGNKPFVSSSCGVKHKIISPL